MTTDVGQPLGSGSAEPEAAGVRSAALSTAVVRLVRSLRLQGVAVTPAESVDAVQALEAADLSDKREVYLSLRAVLTGRLEDQAKFDAAFEEAFKDWGALSASRSPQPADLVEGGRSQIRRRSPKEAAVFLKQWLDRAAGADAEPLAVPAMSDRHAAGRRSFSAFSDDEMNELQRAAAVIARRLATQKSRRWTRAGRGNRVDLRRTLRHLSSSGGDLIDLRYRVRAPRKTRLVVLCDVSGSMELHARLLLQFLYALQRVFARVETFVFSTRLERITDALRSGTYRDALDKLSRDVEGWSGGTRIGESLQEFNHSWRGLVDRKSVVLILSDGWDTGPPELLNEALDTLHRRAGRVVWLNPLLGSPGYEPLTAGMMAALPHVDVFAPCHDVASLASLARHLEL